MLVKLHEPHPEIIQAKQIYKLLKQYFKSIDRVDRDKEHFFVFHVNTRNKLKMMELVSVGALNQTVVHPREVFTRAVSKRSASIFIAHNHPSEEFEPSIDDVSATDKLCEAGKLLSIPVLDHIIYTNKGFYSFKQNGLM